MNWKNMFHNEVFGENVFIIGPEDDPRLVQEVLYELCKEQKADHFSKNRFSIFFMPGTYDYVNINVGFFTQVGGLGLFPTDTKLKKITCVPKYRPDGSINDGLANFWRCVENVEIMEDTLWAVSQASPMRRVSIQKNLYLHQNGGYTSGGFLCDSRVNGITDHGSQQQWFTRNCCLDHISTYGWNQVFMGTEFKHPPKGQWPEVPVTCLDTVPCIQDKPFLIWDKDEGFCIFVPKMRVRSRGISWDKTPEGKKIPLKDCYVAQPEKDTPASMNNALAKGLHLILTPGIYALDQPLHVTCPDTVILGLGLATLTPAQGNPCIVTDNAAGIILAGLLADAGHRVSDDLMVIGDSSKPLAKPAVLSDIFFRIGGFPSSAPSKTVNALKINASHVIGDNLWIWRADHYDQVGWDKNTADTGMIVNGGHVYMYALMVEHFLKYQTLWNGEDGHIYMYQSELPYDVPDQSQWMSEHGTQNGYASLKVADHVQNFESWGVGVYSYHRDAPVMCGLGVKVPDRENVVLHHTFTRFLNGHTGIQHVINTSGECVNTDHRQANIIKYKNGVVYN